MVLFNLLWAGLSVALILLGAVDATRPGTMLILAQAASAAMYALLQGRGLRQSRAATDVALS
jgi:hypothetical protein